MKEKELGAGTHTWQGMQTRCDCVFLICDLPFYTSDFPISFFSPTFIVVRENERILSLLRHHWPWFDIPNGYLASHFTKISTLGSFLCFPSLFLFRLRFLTEQFCFWFCRLGGIQSIWNWNGQVWHFHVSWFVWKQVFYGDSGEEICRKSLAFPDGWVCDRKKFKNKSNFSSSWTFKCSHTKCETGSGALSLLEDTHLKDFTGMDWHCLFVSCFHWLVLSWTSELMTWPAPNSEVCSESSQVLIKICGVYFLSAKHHSLFIFSLSGVWGSAFSILFNRVLGVSNSQNEGPTMEEELGIISK